MTLSRFSPVNNTTKVLDKALMVIDFSSGGEGGIRTQHDPLDSVSCRFYIARIAVNAGDAVAPCTGLHRARVSATVDRVTPRSAGALVLHGGRKTWLLRCVRALRSLTTAAQSERGLEPSSDVVRRPA